MHLWDSHLYKWYRSLHEQSTLILLDSPTSYIIFHANPQCSQHPTGDEQEYEDLQEVHLT